MRPRGDTAVPARTVRLAAAALAFTAGCAREAPPPVAPAIAIDVEYAGCTEVHRGPVCEVAPGAELTVWARAAGGAPPELTIDDAPVATSSQAAVADGVRWRFTVPSDARAVIVRAPQGGPSRVIVPLSHAAPNATLLEVDRLRGSGRFAEGSAALDALADAEGALRARVLGKRARLALATGRTDDALALFREAIELDQANGLMSSEIDDRAALAYVHIAQTFRYVDADAALRPLETLAQQVPQGRSTAAYFAGILAQETGDLRTAAAALARAEAQATRLGQARERRAAMSMEVDVLLTLRQDDRARPLIAALGAALGGITSSCERAQATYNVAMYRLALASDAGQPASLEDVRDLEAAVGLSRDECKNPRKLAHYTAKLAQVLAAQGDTTRARALLDALPPVSGEPVPIVLLADAEVALASGDLSRALSAFERYRAWPSDSPHVAWTSWLGTGRAHRAAGDRARATEAFRMAEEALDAFAFLVPYGSGRASFLEAYADSGRALVDVLLDQGRTGEALEAARHARRRGLAALAWRARLATLEREARGRWFDALSQHRKKRAQLDAESAEDWRLPADRLARRRKEHAQKLAQISGELEAACAELALSPRAGEATPRPLEPGELAILLHDGATSSVLFAALDGEVAALPLGPLDRAASPEDVGERVVTALAPWLARASRVRVWTSGRLDRVDVHALRIGAPPLVAKWPVTYSLDVAGAAPAPAGDAPDVVVVVDPRGDLTRAREEAAIVENAVKSTRGRTVELAGDQGTRAALIAALSAPTVGLLHVASHAVFRGVDGWDSHIGLAHNDALTVADILALDRVPPRVVLAGCETGRDAPGFATSLSLAHALLLAGASAVVATTRAVDDAQAGQVVDALYATPDFRDLPVALGRAQATVDARSPHRDWASFRVVVP